MSDSAVDDTRLEFRPGPGLTGLLLRNFLYGLLTLGFYRFWARTRLRRYLWGAVRLQNEPLEYTGTGRELFLGFIIVMAVFIPVAIFYSIVKVALVGDQTSVTLLDVVYFSVLVLLVGVAQFRARRYRLSRTLWRGIRAGQGGSSWVYMGRFALWLLAAIATFGLSMPWAAADLARYRMRHSFWGSFQGAFEGRAGALAWRMLPFWIAAAALAGHAGYWFYAIAHDDPPEGMVVKILILLALPLVPLMLLIMQVVWLRWYCAGMRIGPMQVRVDFNNAAVVGGVLLGGLVILVVLIAGGFAGFKLLASLDLLPEQAGFVAFVAIGCGIFLGYLTALLLYYHAILLPALKRVLQGVSIIGLEAALEAVQAAPDTLRSGEGLADSFDIPL